MPCFAMIPRADTAGLGACRQTLLRWGGHEEVSVLSPSLQYMKYICEIPLAEQDLRSCKEATSGKIIKNQNGSEIEVRC